VYVHYGGATLLGGTGLILREGSGLVPGTPQAHEWFGLSLATARLGTNNFEFLLIGIPGEPMSQSNPDCNKAGAIQMAMSWPGAGPVPDGSFFLHQDTGAPYNVADTRDCTAGVTPWNMNFGDPASPSKGGEFFGWAIGS
jgi:hypothetical protein